MAIKSFLLRLLQARSISDTSTCPDYTTYAAQLHAPFSDGRFQLSYQRPDPQCRTFISPEVETVLSRINTTINDPDLARLFTNTWPNTLDTAVRWQGYAANNSKEELAFVITGDINAMWLRDSANQLQAYRSVLSSSSSTLAALFRGVINLQARYIITNPYCNAFQPPDESGIPPSVNDRKFQVYPDYDASKVYTCQWQLDSLAAFLQLSTDYYIATSDLEFFREFKWVYAIQAILDVIEAMAVSTYALDGTVNPKSYTYRVSTMNGAATLANRGNGNPVQSGTGLIRSSFRPSDDATIFQLFIPSNMMFQRYLNSTSAIMSALGNQELAETMQNISISLHQAITTYGILKHPAYGDIYAYEVDGYGSVSIMDDANIPSLLSAPFNEYLNQNDPVYKTTRELILSADNPYFAHGPVIQGVGGPHRGPGTVWPMASIVSMLTTDNVSEIYSTLKGVVGSTAQLGLIHESINAWNESLWTRSWFGWGNSLFGQAIVELAESHPSILYMSYQ